MVQTPEKVLKDLQNNQYAPIYFLQGEEPYYIDLIVNYIEKNALSEVEKGFNQLVLYGKDVAMSTVITNARRYPMMSQRQVVIVKEAQEIQDIGKEEGLKLLDNYLKNPLPSTILVFAHKYKSIDGRKAIGKTLENLAVVVSTKKLYENQLPEWIQAFVKSKGYGIEPKAVQMLADNIGNNLERLANEIDKVLINFQPGIVLNPDIIQKLVGISKEYNVFELQKALGTRNVLKVNQIIQYFESNPKNNPLIPIIALLFGFYTKLLLIHHAKDKSERGLASALQINPYIIKEYIFAAKNYPMEKVIDNIHFLSSADLHSKGVDISYVSEGQILKELVFKLLH
ncbi:MAG: DNA polymerase III subunit delta [Bacteroidota bacterium]|nr:DNA polymerase III subunit delta [Bacteroidota bacterium]